MTSRSRDRVSARCLGRWPIHFARGDLRAARDRGRRIVRRSSVTRRPRGSAGTELASGFASGGPRPGRARGGREAGAWSPGLGSRVWGWRSRGRGEVRSLALQAAFQRPVWKAFPVEGRCSQPVEPDRCPHPAFPTQLLH